MQSRPGRLGRSARPIVFAVGLCFVTALAVPLVGARGTAAAPGAQATAPGAAWVQLGPEGEALVRTVSRGAECPALTVDGNRQPMAVRAAAAPPAFPQAVCEAALPAGGSAVAVEDQALPLPRPEPRRIVVVGDAGCRLEEGDPIQDCNSPAAWPFARVAASAAAWQPDLVIHVGDYVYRETPCPPKLAACAGSPWGDTWATWQADVFAPAAPLLRAAPWVFTRGNHEVCQRGGDGWFRLLEPRPYTGACTDYTEPYAVDLGDARLVVLDSAEADDFAVRPEQAALYRDQFARVGELAGPNTWLVLHRPLWAIGQTPGEAGPAGLFRTNPTLQAASDNRLPAGVQLVLSGHLHLWEALTFADGRPPQVVVGNSGTNLDPAITTPLGGLDVGGTTVATGSTRHEWGFLTLERTDTGWLATLRDADGGPVLTCRLVARDLACGS
ncbi:MAG TPA: metallophosphoesterase [Chloroflexota bacterium]|nr:metallophosphoesterase [Chloroflexota bacterium]